MNCTKSTIKFPIFISIENAEKKQDHSTHLTDVQPPQRIDYFVQTSVITGLKIDSIFEKAY